MSCTRLGASTVLMFALAAFVGGQEPKKEPPKTEPPKTDPKAAPKTEPPKTDPKTQPPAPVDGKTFAFKFEKDKKFYQEVTTNVIQVIKVQGQDLTQNQSSTFYFEWTPLEEKDGKWTVKQKVEGLRMTIDISGNLISYDSTKADSPTAGNPGLSEFFKNLVGSEFTATIDKAFKVEKVDGKKEFIAKLGSGSPQMDNLLNKIMTDDALKQMCDPTLGVTPDAPKKAGDSWEKKSVLNLGPIGTFDVTYKFKFVGPDAAQKDMDKIEVETALVYNAPKEDPAAGGLLFRIKEGKLTQPTPAPGEPPAPKGTILYNTKTQRVESADITLKLKGELTVAIGGTDTKVELNQEQKTSLKTRDTTFIEKK